MTTYKDILKDEYIINLYNDIEEKTNYVVSHGLQHVKNVLSFCKQLANVLSLSNQKRKLLYIACLLHDVGRNIDNKTHNEESVKFAQKYLKNKIPINNLHIISDAIFYHSTESSDFTKMDDIAYILLLSDKLDILDKRLLPNLLYQANSSHFDLYKACKKIDIQLQNNYLIFNFYSNNNNLKNIIENMWHNKIKIILDNFVSHFKLNGYIFNFV